MKSILLILALLLVLQPQRSMAGGEAIPQAAQERDLSQLEQEGFEALEILGFQPNKMSRRQLREAAILRAYQKSWNDYDPSIKDLANLENPQRVVDHFTDGPGLLYRDLCVPSGLKSKRDLLKYLTVLYRKYPRQAWGHGWQTIRLFPGSAPGEWAYFYDFEMFRSLTPGEKPAITGTGMEKVRFDDSGRLISDEIHLVLSSGVANCKFGPE